jgi:hypothetical protein
VFDNGIGDPTGDSNSWLFGVDSISFQTQAAVPEPVRLTLLGIGAVSAMGYVWRRRKQTA